MITVECFNPDQFLSTLDMTNEHKILDLKNRIEASIVIWKRKMNQKDGKSTWGSAVSIEKREVFEERAETILIILKQRFPGLPQSSLDISKIQYNRVSLTVSCPGGYHLSSILKLKITIFFTGCGTFCARELFKNTREFSLYGVVTNRRCSIRGLLDSKPESTD